MSIFRRKPRHHHAFQIVAVEHERYTRGPNQTRILYRCSCGKRLVEAEAGIWTKDQLTGRAS